MIREAGPTDRAAVKGLLQRRTDTAMFPLANHCAHGLGGGLGGGLGDAGLASDHPHATRFWWLGDQSLRALSRGGMLMPCLTDDSPLAPLRSALSGQRVEGAIGPAAAVRPLLAALGLSGLPTRKDEDEPAFALDLADLRTPDLPDARLVPATADQRVLLLAWRAACHAEILGTPAAERDAQAAADIDGILARGNHRVLLHKDRPVALTGFNAALPDIVQVGGVYTPPALRGRGYARQAVALHLAEARAAGVSRAVLFAASPAAARACRAIGFKPTGSFALVLLATPATIGP